MEWAYNFDPPSPTDSEATLELVFCIRQPVQREKELGDPLGLIWAADWAAAVMYPEILIYCFPWNPTTVLGFILYFFSLAFFFFSAASSAFFCFVAAFIALS